MDSRPAVFSQSQITQHNPTILHTTKANSVYILIAIFQVNLG